MIGDARGLAHGLAGVTRMRRLAVRTLAFSIEWNLPLLNPAAKFTAPALDK